MWLASRFGWPLDYVDSLDIFEAREVITVMQAMGKAEADEAAKAMRRRRR